MGLLEMIGFGGGGAKDTEIDLPEVFPFEVMKNDFIRNDIETVYARILTDVLERTQNIPEDKKMLLWDNCLGSEKSDGLVSLMARAMFEKSELYVVYDSATNVVRKANATETTQIRKDYEAQAKSDLGVYITFKNFKKSDMMKVYSALEYCAIGGLHKSMNLAMALQFKMNDMRGSVSASDSSVIGNQAKSVAEALKKGKAVLIDAKDIIETAKPDMTATNSAMDFISQKKSFYLGLPATYITGESSKGLGDSGQGDAKAVERGLKFYYFSIIKPVIEAIFGIKTEFESEDYAGISTSLETLKTFELTSNEFLSSENKRVIVNRLFGLPENTKGDSPAAVTPPVVPQV